LSISKSDLRSSDSNYEAFAVYGYFEDKDRLIPTVIKSYLTNTALNLSSPYFVRDFIFIEDIIDAYLKAIENIKVVKGEIFNLGTGKQTQIAQLVSIVKKLTHHPSSQLMESGSISIRTRNLGSWYF